MPGCQMKVVKVTVTEMKACQVPDFFFGKYGNLIFAIKFKLK